MLAWKFQYYKREDYNVGDNAADSDDGEEVHGNGNGGGDYCILVLTLDTI